MFHFAETKSIIWFPLSLLNFFSAYVICCNRSSNKTYLELQTLKVYRLITIAFTREINAADQDETTCVQC